MVTLSSPLKVSVCKLKSINTLPVNSREACGLVAVIFDPYWILSLLLFILGIIKTYKIVKSDDLKICGA